MPGVADLTRGVEAERLVRETVQRFGPVDLLVNSAGGFPARRLLVETDESEWDWIMAVNLKSAFLMCKAVLPSMIERRTGRIVCVASDAGRVGSSGEVVYSAAKGGVIAFSKALAREVARFGVLVNAVAPGPADTPFLKIFSDDPANERIVEAMVRATPLRRLARPDDVAGAIAFLASDDAAFMTGQTVSVSGGLTML
jgi:2-hydroxycyclohexanecarboxyl-CoA dehydrogenase